MTKDERELLRRLEKFNSRQLPALVAEMFAHPSGSHFPAHCWYQLADLLAPLAADLRQAGDDAAGVITAEVIESWTG